MTNNDQSPQDSSMTNEEALPAVFPTAAEVFGIAELERNRHRMRLSCATLPSNLNNAGNIDTSSPSGTGLGLWLNTAIGGGIRPGFFGLLTSTRHKAGKSTFLDQLVFGLTMQGARNHLNQLNGNFTGPMIRAWVLSSASEEQLEMRLIERYIGCPRGALSDGGTTPNMPSVREIALRRGISPDAVTAEIFDRAREVLSEDDRHRATRVFRQARKARRYVPDFTAETGSRMLDSLSDMIDCDRRLVVQETGIPTSMVWPILLVDSIQHFAAADEVDAFVKKLHTLTNPWTVDGSDGMIVFATSDVCSTYATNTVITTARAVGGSHMLCHLPNATLLLDTVPDESDPRRARSTITVGYCRDAPETNEAFPFNYDTIAGRFSALPPDAKPAT